MLGDPPRPAADVGAEQAFDVLRQESMRRNVKVAELAEQVVYTGTL